VASGGASPGPGTTANPAGQPYADGTVDAVSAQGVPKDAPTDATAPGEAASTVTTAAVVAGTLTISGRTHMYDRNGNYVNQKLLIELLDVNYNHLTWGYSEWDGTWSFAISNPGQFRLRVWTYFHHTTQVRAAIRVVPQGNTSGLFDVSGYNYNVGPFGPYGDGSVNVGDWRPADDWDGRRAWWIYQDLQNAFYYPWYAVSPNGSRQPDGGTAEWTWGNEDGTYYDYSHINLATVDAFSPHVSTHEYGHNVMHNVYGSSPGTYFPTNDCTSPHYIERAGGTNCSWTEGWADFYALAVLNDPVWKWGCFAPCTPPSRDMENRTGGGTWDSGEFVEGNVAGSLWDWIDYNQDGSDLTDPSLTPFSQIWDIFWNHDDNRFLNFWNDWTGAGYNGTNTRASLQQNTISYGWTGCPDYTLEPDQSSGFARSFPVGSSVSRSLCTTNDSDWYYFWGLAGYQYRIETLNLSTGADTTLTLYDGSLVQKGFDDDGGTTYHASLINYVVPTTGWHYVKAARYQGYGSLAYTYSLRILQDSPPTVTAPAPIFLNNQALGNPSAGVYTLTVQQRWTSSDGDGIASQDLEQSLNGGAFADVSPQPSAAAQTYNTTLAVGSTNQFRVRAFDSVGAFSGYATGSSFKIYGYQESNTAITYTGTWIDAPNANAFGGRFKFTDGSTGAKASFSFTGARIALVGTQTSNGGIADVYLNGILKGSVNFYSSTTRNRRVLFTLNGLGGQNVVELRWRRAHSAGSTGYRLNLDGFLVGR